MDGFDFIVPDFGDPARGIPIAPLEAHLADQDQGDEPEIDALVDEVDNGINADERKDVEDESSNEEEHIAVAGHPLAGLDEGHRSVYFSFPKGQPYERQIQYECFCGCPFLEDLVYRLSLSSRP